VAANLQKTVRDPSLKNALASAKSEIDLLKTLAEASQKNPAIEAQLRRAAPRS